MVAKIATKRVRSKLLDLALEFTSSMNARDFDHIYENLITPSSSQFLSTMAWPLLCYERRNIDLLINPELNPNASIPIIESLSLAFQMDLENCRTDLFQGIASVSQGYGWTELNLESTMAFTDKQSAILLVDTQDKPLILLFVEQKNGDYLIDFTSWWLFSMNMRASIICEIADNAMKANQKSIAIEYYSIASKLGANYSRINRLMCDHPAVGSIITFERKIEIKQEEQFTRIAQEKEKLIRQERTVENAEQMQLDEYEKILKIIESMAKVIGRNPDAFQNLKEEHIRNHFLVQLNGHYPGNATGETFNYRGKTDILLRKNDVNLFIAECKFWKSQQTVKETVDQILRYSTWNDAKLALLIFNRSKNLTDILEKISYQMKNHSSFYQEINFPSETGFRYLINHPTDSRRHLILTILVFEIPE